jgi:methyl-accepting chemotaxis protein
MKKKANNEENVKIERQLVNSFILTTGLTALTAIITLIALLVTSNLYTNALTDFGFAQGDIGKAMTYFSETRSFTRAVIGYSDPELIATSQEGHDKSKALFEDAIADVEHGIVTDKAREQYDEIMGKLDAYWELDAQIIKVGATTDMGIAARAQETAATELAPKFNEINDILTDIMETKIAAGNEQDTILKIMSLVLLIAIVVLIGVIILVSIKIGKKLAKRIATSLQTVSQRMETFAAGDLSSEFPEFDIKDEIEDLALTTKHMADNLKIILNDIDNHVASIADGNFLAESSCPERYVGEFASLHHSIDNLIIKMKGTLLQINEASEQVEAGSSQLAESAVALAEGAMDQAGAVQELTATIENVTGVAEGTAKEVNDAYQEGLTYREQAEQGSDEMKQLAEAMERISTASKEIENIIAEIEDIASQTNLLSLNASIEAARAGEAGKGFAVVADQIGKLATDSAESAVRTRELIQHTLEEIEKGNAITERTEEALNQVVHGIEFLSDTSKHASDAFSTQVSTMQEVEKGVEQISSVVQSNSAAAQETSATGEELAAQATNLKELIGQFTLR